jgi:hypothetical protein
MKSQRIRKPSAKALENELSNLYISSSSRKPDISKATLATAAPLSNSEAESSLPSIQQPKQNLESSLAPLQDAQEVGIYIYINLG